MATRREKFLLASCIILLLWVIALLSNSPWYDCYIVPKEEKKLHHGEHNEDVLFFECWAIGPPIPLYTEERRQLEEILIRAKQYPPEGTMVNLNTRVTYDIEYSMKALIPFYDSDFLFSSDGSLVNGILSPVDEIRLQKVLLPIIERAKKIYPTDKD